jgi:hypothetical protein
LLNALLEIGIKVKVRKGELGKERVRKVDTGWCVWEYLKISLQNIQCETYNSDALRKIVVRNSVYSKRISDKNRHTHGSDSSAVDCHSKCKATEKFVISPSNTIPCRIDTAVSGIKFSGRIVGSKEEYQSTGCE